MAKLRWKGGDIAGEIMLKRWRSQWRNYYIGKVTISRNYVGKRAIDLGGEITLERWRSRWRNYIGKVTISRNYVGKCDGAGIQCKAIEAFEPKEN